MKRYRLFFVFSMVTLGNGTYFIIKTTPWLFDTTRLTYEVMVFRMGLLFVGWTSIIACCYLLWAIYKGVHNGRR